MDNLQTIAIEGGEAIYMGEGVIALLQGGDEGPQAVTVTADDLRRLLAAWE